MVKIREFHSHPEGKALIRNNDVRGLVYLHQIQQRQPGRQSSVDYYAAGLDKIDFL